jgi:hypothetical protein
MLSYPHFPLVNKNKNKRKEAPHSQLRDYEPIAKNKIKETKTRKTLVDKD